MNMVTLLVGIILIIFIAILGYFINRASRKKRWKEQIKYSHWSIGYQVSAGLYDIRPETASIYSKDQMPAETAGIADPFLLEHRGEIYLFYELILNSVTAAKIAVSTYDPENNRWDFHSIVLDEPFHLSYPYVFKHGSDVYMIPESKKVQSVRLYRSVGFPTKWEFERILIKDKKFVDSSIVYWKGHFFLFTSRKRTLYLFYSTSLAGDWKLHPEAPVKRWNYARCAGRIIEHNGKLFRFAQEQAKGYGMGVRLYEILDLSTKNYKEVPVDHDLLLRPFGDSWAQHGMHHIDILRLADNKYLSVFDGRGVSNNMLKV